MWIFVTSSRLLFGIGVYIQRNIALHVHVSIMCFDVLAMFLEPVDIFSDEPVSSSGQPLPHPPVLDEVTWEYRWEDKEDSDIHGPYNSTQMSEWKENG